MHARRKSRAYTSQRSRMRAHALLAQTTSTTPTTNTPLVTILTTKTNLLSASTLCSMPHEKQKSADNSTDPTHSSFVIPSPVSFPLPETTLEALKTYVLVRALLLYLPLLLCTSHFSSSLSFYLPSLSYYLSSHFVVMFAVKQLIGVIVTGS